MAEAILFLPGLNCTSALFQPQIDIFSKNRVCMVADHGIAETIEDIVADILNKAPKTFIAVGLSMGGYLALEILRQQPERARAAVLLDTRASEDSEEDALRRIRTIELVQKGQFDTLHSILWPRLVHSDRIKDKPLEAIVKGMMADTGAKRFIRQQKAVLNRPEFKSVLANISIPVLVGVGREDAITPVSMAEELVSGIPGADLAIFENCGHLSTLEKPNETSGAITDFLMRNSL